MLQWIRNFILRRMGQKAAMSDFQTAYEKIKRLGSSDLVCKEVLRKIDGDPELRKFIDSVGARDALLPFDRTTISFSAINSLMLARRDLLSNPSSESAQRRLEDALRVFRYSFLILSEQEFTTEAEKQAQGIMLMLSGKPRPASLYDERVKQAEDALPKWMAADLSQHAFIV